MLKILLILTAALLLSVPLGADGQGADAAGQTGDKAPVKQTGKNPKRQITFKISDEELPMTLPDADPKLLEQRYVASVVLVLPPQDFPFSPGSRGSVGIKMLQSRFGGRFRGRSSEATGLEQDLVFLYQVFSTGSRAGARLGDVLVRLEKLTPSEHRPSKDVLTFFEQKRDRSVQLSMSSRRDERGTMTTVTFRIMAPTTDRVKQLSAGLLLLIDNGFSARARQFYQDQRKPIADRVASYEEQLTAAQAELGQVQKELEAADEISAVALTELKTQQWQLAVDRAGVEARIKACTKMMDQKNVSPPVVERVFTIKIGAEIELAGLNAKKQMLERIVAKGVERATLEKKIKQLRGSQTSFVNSSTGVRRSLPIGGIVRFEYYRDRYQRSVDGLDTLIALYAPFPLQDDTIVIQPIKWEKRGK